jgi:hypothetical protein
VPIGYVELNRHEKQVIVPGLTAGDIAALPELRQATPSRNEEEELLATIERALDARNPFLRVDFSHRQMST